MANFTTTGSDVYPAGVVIQVKGTDNFHTQSFDTDVDVIIEVALTNVLASSYAAIWTSCTTNIASSGVGEGLETYVHRKATSMGVAGTVISGATLINASGGNANSAAFTYFESHETKSFNMYAQANYHCVDESPATGTNYYALSGSAYSTQLPTIGHDGNTTIMVMEISQ